MTVATHFMLRDARDRITDVLGIGQTYPLRDLPVGSDRLTVAYGTPAKIAVQGSQVGVTYLLLKRGTSAAAAVATVAGNGDTIQLVTQPIKEDTEFEVLARRGATNREGYLYQAATVKVGLDQRLDAKIRGALLNPAADNPLPTDARIADYGAEVEVEIISSQEGVLYRLVQNDAGDAQDPSKDTVLSTPDVRGNLGAIVLTTKVLHEDVDIRVRAVKQFDKSENRQDQTTLLNAVLSMKIRANPQIDLEVARPIVDYAGQATLRVNKPQASAAYQVHVRPIRDSEFARGAANAQGEIVIPVRGQPDVRITLPQRGPVWTMPAKSKPVGQPGSGKGATLSFPFGPLTEDSLVIVEARKTHTVIGGTPIVSAVRIARDAAVLVRPDPARPLVAQFTVQSGKTDGFVVLSGGEPGVFYYLRTSRTGKDRGLPAYFHQQDDTLPTHNKGVGQLVLEVDFVLPRGAGGGSTVRPDAPRVETGSLNVGSKLYVRAVKAQTRLSAELNQTLDVQPSSGTR